MEKGKLIPVQYAAMAISGTPDGKEKYDADMAAAYLRLVREPAKPVSMNRIIYRRHRPGWNANWRRNC